MDGKINLTEEPRFIELKMIWRKIAANLMAIVSSITPNNPIISPIHGSDNMTNSSSSANEC